MNSRWQKILAGIGELEKKSPYNYCDHPNFSFLFQNGSLDGPNFNFVEIDRYWDRWCERCAPEPGVEEEEISPEAFEGPEFAEIRRHIEFVRSSPLPRIAETYRERARAFLEGASAGGKESYAPEIRHDLDTVAWYHTLLVVKVERGLAGFHEPTCEGDLALYDAVGQFEICKKAVRESLKALRNLRERLPGQSALVPGLLALLHHLQDNIRILEESL